MLRHLRDRIVDLIWLGFLHTLEFVINFFLDPEEKPFSTLDE